MSFRPLWPMLLLAILPVASADGGPSDFRLFATDAESPRGAGTECDDVRGAEFLAAPMAPNVAGRAFLLSQPCLSGFRHVFERATTLEGPFRLDAEFGCMVPTLIPLTDLRFVIHHTRGTREWVVHDAGVNYGVVECGPDPTIPIPVDLTLEPERFLPNDELVIRIFHTVPAHPEFAQNAFIVTGPREKPLLQAVPASAPGNTPPPAGPEISGEPLSRAPDGSSRSSLAPLALVPLLPLLLFRPLWAALYARVLPERLTNHELRSKIIGLVREQPGISAVEIQGRLETPRGTLRFHINMLVRGGLVSARRIGRSVHLFEAGAAGQSSLTRSVLMRRPWARRVVEAVIEKPGISQRDLAATLRTSPSTALWFTRRLTEAGILATKKEGRRRTYTAKDEA